MKGILKDKVAVITGSSRGLGYAIADVYAREGAKVIIASRTQKAVDEAVTNIRQNGADAEGLACDVSDIQQVEALAEFAIQKFGQLDIWVNNAGLSAPYGPTAHIPSHDFMDVVNTNIIGTYNGSTVAMRQFVRQGHGKLINLLGRGDNGSVPLQNAYSSSKVWVNNFTKALAQEYKDSGIEVIGFNPGLVKTEMLSNVYAVSGYEEKLSPLRFVAMLWGNEADIPAEKAAWLASSATDGKTGLVSTVLTRRMMITRLIMLPFKYIFDRSTQLLDLNVTSVKPAIGD